jgi:hypothetical protein
MKSTMQSPSLIDLEENPPPPYAPHNPSLTDSFSTTITLPVRPCLRGGYIRPTLSPGEPDLAAAASSARLYFEERPCMVQYPSYILEHHITLPAATTREPLKFPHPEQKYQERDVSVADWNTFVNYLVLDHTESLAEKEEDSNDRSERIEAVLVEWNDGFFGPRGIHIHYDSLPAEAPAYTPRGGVSVHPELKSIPATTVSSNPASPGHQEAVAKRHEAGRQRHHHCGPHSRHRRSSVSPTTSTSSSSSLSSCSIDSFSSGDLVSSDFSQIFGTLSSLRRNPTPKSKLKASIRQIVNDVRAQRRAIPRTERKQWSREFKTELHTQKKAIKTEVKSLFKEAKAAHKVERKARKAERKAEWACSRAQRACSRAERKERRSGCRNQRREDSTVEIEKGMTAHTIEAKAAI